MTTLNAKFEQVEFATAEDFLRALAPIPTLETKTPYPEFIFRGHADENWPLVSNALRLDKSSGRTKAVALLGSGSTDSTADLQNFAEFHLLKSFIDFCDRAVIALPGDSHEFRSIWMNDQKSPVEAMYRHTVKWPFPQHLPLLAVAQHHGVPTRLLDWTRSATIAAYFAASEAIKPENRTARLAIWALNIELLPIYPHVELVAMPGANSQRLGAQKGLFTIVKDEAVRGSPVKIASFEDALVSENEDASRPKPLWKLTLPQSEALRLLYLCHLNGVDASSVYPGLEGAARATLERAEWQRKDPMTGHDAVSMRPFVTQKTKSQDSRSRG